MYSIRRAAALLRATVVATSLSLGCPASIPPASQTPVAQPTSAQPTSAQPPAESTSPPSPPAPPPSASATASSPAAVAAPALDPPPKPAGCPDDLPPAQAESDYQDALRAIKRAGEHPSNADLGRLLPLLRNAAYSGNLEAQSRYGSYVVGYWATDEMFWPNDRKTAVSALAMLRVSVRRRGNAAEPWSIGLGRNPVVQTAEPLSSMPKAWLREAVSEADRWERCHPGVVPP